MKARSPRAILFDFDGVIVDSERLHHRAYEQVLAPYGVTEIPFAVYADVFSNRGVGLEYCAERVPGLQPIELKRLKERAFLEILKSDASLLPGVGEALTQLSACFPLALATGSTRAAAALVLERFGLRDRFTTIVAREDYQRDKPHPDAYLEACAALGVEPAGCLAVEDSVKGLRAAGNAGIRCVVVPNEYTRGGDFGDAAAVLDSIRELSVERAEAIYAGRGPAS